MSAASGGEREGRKWAGGTPDPVRGASPPAPPLDEWMSELLRFLMHAACGGELEGRKWAGDTPDPGRRTASPCTPCSTVRDIGGDYGDPGPEG